MVWYSTAVM